MNIVKPYAKLMAIHGRLVPVDGGESVSLSRLPPGIEALQTIEWAGRIAPRAVRGAACLPLGSTQPKISAVQSGSAFFRWRWIIFFRANRRSCVVISTNSSMDTVLSITLRESPLGAPPWTIELRRSYAFLIWRNIDWRA